MKKVLLIASFIVLFMAAGMDLQARYRGNDLQHGRSVVSSSRTRQAPTRDRAGSYSRYGDRQGRDVRGGVTIDRSRQAPSRDRSSSYSRYGNGYNSYSQYGNGYNNYSRYGNRHNNYSRYNNYPGRYSRGGISLGLSVYAPLLGRYNGYNGYYYSPGRYIATEIRRNEERIWILQERMDQLFRYGDGYGEIRALEREIIYLQRRNDFLRSQLY